MRALTLLLVLVPLLAGVPALPAAAESGGEADPTANEALEEVPGALPLGTRTRAWMERQRSGLEESPHPTGLTPPEDYRARRRHLDSFSHPIPDLYDFDSLSGSGK